MGSIAALFGGFALTAHAAAAPNWNTSGAYVVGFELGGTFPHDMSLLQNLLVNVTGGGKHE